MKDQFHPWRESVSPSSLERYRTGQYAETADALGPFSEEKDPAPNILAVLAMTHNQLGRKDKAEDYLNRLREMMKSDRWTKDEEAQNFLREAEELISKLAATRNR